MPNSLESLTDSQGRRIFASIDWRVLKIALQLLLNTGISRREHSVKIVVRRSDQVFQSIPFLQKHSVDIIHGIDDGTLESL